MSSLQGCLQRGVSGERVPVLFDREWVGEIGQCAQLKAVRREQLGKLTKQVFDIVRGEAVCRRLTSVPGVGPITALAFRATIDLPKRFRRSRDVGAHLGLTPARYQSGETDIQGKISRCGDELARSAPVACAGETADEALVPEAEVDLELLRRRSAGEARP